MTGIFKSLRQNNRDLMKHLGLVHILLLLGVGLLFGQAAAELTAYQDLIPSANVGQTVMVTVSLTYNGYNSTQAIVTPYLPFGIVANAGSQSADLYPGITQQISYPLAAQQSGTYWIVSDISYAEEGTWRNLRLEAPFTAIGQSEPQQTLPGGIGLNASGPNASSIPVGPDPFAMPPGGVLPEEAPPQPEGETPESGPPEGMPNDGESPPQDTEERPPLGQ
jgi:hypothetical protein